MDGELKFYPEHPSGTKTLKIETSEMTILQQNTPFDVKALCDEFATDPDAFFARYTDKRFEVTGIATKVGPDIHNKPSIELSDRIGGKTHALVIFPTEQHYSKVKIGDRVTVRANYLVMSNWYGTVMKYSELVSLEKSKPTVLNYPLFDGKKLIENASVVIENGVITSVTETENADRNCLLMPGLIDAHTHMNTMDQIQKMLENGVTSTCDVSAPASLTENSKHFTIISSAGMTMGTLSGKSYVKKAISGGARYIKVLLLEPNLMLKGVFKDICKAAHKNNLKVAVHAVSLKAVEMSIDCGADILIHVPMNEEFPKDLAQKIVKRNIVVVPTLVMMKAFADRNRNGYKPTDYTNAANAVNLMHFYGVRILAGTDANMGTFAPAIPYGISMHHEMGLLVQAGLTPLDVLKTATSDIAEAFDIKNIGVVAPGQPATMILIEGRPDRRITDSVNIKQVWINGTPFLL